jgi:hypothetical protein
MKHLKSFNQINESTFGDFISQSKPYWDIDDIEFDYIRDELDDIKGRHTITDREKSKIERILNGYLRTEVTGMKILDIRQTKPHCIDLHYNLGSFEVNTEISVYCYEDDYFVLNIHIPVSTPSSDKAQYIVMEEFFYVIDGWDGFEEFVEKTSPYTQNQEMYKLLKSPLKDLSPKDYIEVPDGLFHNLVTNYPHVRLFSNSRFYFFDPSRGGEYFCRVEKRGTTRQNKYYYDDGTLLDDGTRSRSRQ